MLIFDGIIRTTRLVEGAIQLYIRNEPVIYISRIENQWALADVKLEHVSVGDYHEEIRRPF